MFVSHVAFDMCRGTTAIVTQWTGEIFPFRAHVHAKMPFHIGDAEKFLSAMITDKVEWVQFFEERHNDRIDMKLRDVTLPACFFACFRASDRLVNASPHSWTLQQ